MRINHHLSSLRAAAISSIVISSSSCSSLLRGPVHPDPVATAERKCAALLGIHQTVQSFITPFSGIPLEFTRPFTTFSTSSSATSCLASHQKKCPGYPENGRYTVRLHCRYHRQGKTRIQHFLDGIGTTSHKNTPRWFRFFGMVITGFRTPTPL